MDMAASTKPKAEKEAGSGWARAALWDLAAASLILLAPFASFLNFRDYGLAHLEVLLASAFLVGVGLLIAAVIRLRPSTLRPLVFLCMVMVMVVQCSLTVSSRSWTGQSSLAEHSRRVGWSFLKVSTCTFEGNP